MTEQGRKIQKKLNDFKIVTCEPNIYGTLLIQHKMKNLLQKIKKDEDVFSIRSSEVNTLYCVFIILTPSTNISRPTFFSQ